jgi:DNA-binding NarL/FixJ family response regulator
MKVLIVDDHALIRDALARVVAGLAADMVVLQATDPQAAFETIEREPELDLVLLDLALPGMHGLSVLKSLREKHPSVAVVVVSASSDRDNVTRALDHGALGFIPKSSSNEVLASALKLVLAGGIYVPPEVLGRGQGELPMSPPLVTAHTLPADIGLTQRQAEILALMMKGKSNKLICRDLDLAESTVKNQVTAIMKALNVTSRTQAVLAVNRLGLTLPEVGGGVR